jgi:hypothetical protein
MASPIFIGLTLFFLYMIERVYTNFNECKVLIVNELDSFCLCVTIELSPCIVNGCYFVANLGGTRGDVFFVAWPVWYVHITSNTRRNINPNLGGGYFLPGGIIPNGNRRGAILILGYIYSR